MLKKMTIFFFQTWIAVYQPTRRNVLGDCKLQQPPLCEPKLPNNGLFTFHTGYLLLPRAHVCPEMKCHLWHLVVTRIISPVNIVPPSTHRICPVGCNRSWLSHTSSQLEFIFLTLRTSGRQTVVSALTSLSCG